MDIAAELVKVLGGLAGIVALIWRIVDEFGGWLRIGLKVETSSAGEVTALTTVDNRSNRPKPIEFACLLVAPEHEDPVMTASILAKALGLGDPFESTNELARLHAVVRKSVYTDGRALVPLPFYYDEQIDIADETLTYRAPLETARLSPNVAYSVRFFIFVTGRLHRSTHDAFITPRASSAAPSESAPPPPRIPA
jgi:hypothetical protein